MNFEHMYYPDGFSDPDSDNYKKLRSKGVIYEVTLKDWIAREDIDGTGKMMKTIIKKGLKGDRRKPKEIDEVTLSYSLKQGEKEIEKKENEVFVFESLPVTL